MSATSVPIPSAPEDSQPEADDSVSPPPGVVTTSPQVPPASEPEYPQSSATAEANPQADPNPATVHHVSYWSLGGHTVHVPTQLATAMTRYEPISDQSQAAVCPISPKAFTANVSRAVANMAGSAVIRQPTW